ncbi:hypothetical protein SEVIR_2G125602v4 [Setaria viridis]
MAAAAADDSAIPNWVMLERFVFRRDDPKSFREDKRTFASGTNSAGTQFDVSFILAEPPTPSRLYLSWPEGPKQEDRCHLAWRPTATSSSSGSTTSSTNPSLSGRQCMITSST